MCVGGLLFTEEAAGLMDKELVRLYLECGVPWYRPGRCASGKAPFDKFDLKNRERLRETVGNFVIKYATAAMSAAVPRDLYKKIVGPALPDQSDYQFCVHSCLGSVKDWAIENEYQGRVQYCFKAGSEYETATDDYLKSAMQDPSNREYSHYDSHSFKPKTEPLLNAAELFAWEAANTFEGVLIGRATGRGYLKFIKEKHCNSKSFFEEHLSAIVDSLRQQAKPTNLPLSPGFQQVNKT
jgi:hypothetical protein